MSAVITAGQSAQLSNGMRLSYASAGRPGNPLMLFVHGFPEAWFEWEEQLPVFGEDHFAVAPDLRGFGQSGKPKGVEHYRPKLVVEDLRLLVAALGYDDAVVVAHDWGGAIAWNLAIFHPEMVQRLIIINAPHPYLFMRDLAECPEQQQASAYMNWLRAEGSEAALAKDDFVRLDQMLNTPATGGRTWYTPTVKARYHALWSIPGEDGSHPLSGSVNYYRASPLHPPLDPTGAGGPGAALPAPSLWTTQVPVRVIWGEADTALRIQLLEGLADFCSDLRVTRIPEGSHWVIHEQPERIGQLIRAALTD